MLAEKSDIPVFPHFQASHDFVYAQLNGGIDGDKPERLLLVQASVLHGFGRIVEQPADALTAVGIDGHQHPFFCGVTGIVGNPL